MGRLNLDGEAISKLEITRALAEARQRTLELLDPVPPGDQARQVSPLMSPLGWDLAHIGHYEELWLIRELTGAQPTDALYDDIYDAFKHPRRERESLPILDPAGARQFDADVRKRALDVLDGIHLDPARPLLADGFVYGMVVQHEHQHDETMLATLQLMEQYAHPGADGLGRPVPPVAASLAPDVLVDGGTFVMGVGAPGSGTAPWAYDNERPAHDVTLAPFRIDTTPVTNGAFLAFVDAGGYDDPRHWTDEGWAWRNEAALAAPQFWRREGNGAWSRLRFGRREDLPPAEPVQHVCWYEADAFARWSGARLPTEAEWERAAAGASTAHANLWSAGLSTTGDPIADANRFGPDPAGSRPESASACGAQQLFGDVWEWTSTDFHGYPGFRSFPYREYSEVFFGPEYKVLRGGSWATHPSAMRATFRNWDYPIRRQIFAGFRCARRLTRLSPMCRHLAYLGPPIALRTLLFDTPHSLSEQAARPWHQPPDRVNKDGWGVGWFRADGAIDDRYYRTVTSMWDDHDFALGDVHSDAFVAAARLASPGATLDPTGNAPFRADGWLFSLNGYVKNYRDGVEQELRAGLSAQRRDAIVGDADTEVVFALVLDRLDAGDTPQAALVAAITRVASLSETKLNLLLTDGREVHGTRYGNSLFGCSTIIASEPLDDDSPGRAWREIPEESLVLMTGPQSSRALQITAL